jgi:hypothetical protein
LITFKSHHDALDDWALKELTRHYVNYRKQCTPRKRPLLTEADFWLYAVCSRYPQNLASHLPLEPVQPGVYACERGTDRIRIIVAGQVPEEPQNALLHLFSASAERVGYGAGHYEQRSHDTNPLLGRVLTNYRREGKVMSYTMADFRRDTAKEYLEELTPEERQDVLQSMAPEKRQEVLRGLSAEELLAALAPEEIAKYLKKLQSEPPSRKSKPRRKS